MARCSMSSSSIRSDSYSVELLKLSIVMLLCTPGSESGARRVVMRGTQSPTTLFRDMDAINALDCIRAP